MVDFPKDGHICTGFIDALNVTRESTLENLCVFGLLGDIWDTDFCFDTKMIKVLEEVVNSAVFDSIIKTVANFTRQHCDMICNSSNELCWAFGITAKLILRQSVMSTTATEPTTAPTTEPTTAAVELPDFFTTKPPHPSDDHTDDDDDTTVTPTDDDKNGPSKSSLISGSIYDVQIPDASSHGGVEGGDSTAGTDANDEPGTPTSPSTDDDQDVQTNTTINSDNNNATVNPTSANITIIIANTTVTTKPTTANTTATNASEILGHISEEGPPGSDTIPVDVDDGDSYFTDETGQTSQEEQSNHDSSDHSSIMDHVIDVVDDDDDYDDGYSYWHFAAILLFILFLGVAGYLASHNRKKVKNHNCTSMCSCTVVILLLYGYSEITVYRETCLSVNF